MQNQDFLEISPHDPSWWNIIIKTLLGLIVGIFISFLVFIILVLLGGIIEQALTNSIVGDTQINPLLPLILIIIGFIGTFIGSILLSGIYNVIFTEKYYDMNKMFSLVLFANIILFTLFLPLYLIFAASIDQLFFVLAFHIIFASFLSFALIESSTNPNYCAVHMIGAALGLTIAIIIFALFYKYSDLNTGRSAHIMLSLPPVLAYLSLPFWHGLREKIYFRFYSMGNNFFYIPSLNEVLMDAEESDDVEVDIDMD